MGMEPMALFFDSESQSAAHRHRQEESSRLIETARAMNREQLRGLDGPARHTETGKAVSYPSVREYVINTELETATVRAILSNPYTHTHTHSCACVIPTFPNSRSIRSSRRAGY